MSATREVLTDGTDRTSEVDALLNLCLIDPPKALVLVATLLGSDHAAQWYGPPPRRWHGSDTHPGCIEQHLDTHSFNILKKAEEEPERQALAIFLRAWIGDNLNGGRI